MYEKFKGFPLSEIVKLAYQFHETSNVFDIWRQEEDLSVLILPGRICDLCGE